MKTSPISKSILAALVLTATATVLSAQTTPNPACPFGYEPGYGRSLTPEQRAEHQAVIQQEVANLQVKRQAGTCTAEELAWLEQLEQRGGLCLTGTPRGRGAGKGQGKGQGMGQRRRQGARDGSGPRGQNGTCPLGNTPQPRGGR